MPRCTRARSTGTVYPHEASHSLTRECCSMYVYTYVHVRTHKMKSRILPDNCIFPSAIIRIANVAAITSSKTNISLMIDGNRIIQRRAQRLAHTRTHTRARARARAHGIHLRSTISRDKRARAFNYRRNLYRLMIGFVRSRNYGDRRNSCRARRVAHTRIPPVEISSPLAPRAAS